MSDKKIGKADAERLAAAAEILERHRFHAIAGSIRALREVRKHTEKDA